MFIAAVKNFACLFFVILCFSSAWSQQVYRGDDVIGSCNTPTHPDYQVMKRFYEDLSGTSWTRRSNWLSCNVCTWEGITCIDNRVSQIDLNNNNLNGTFSIGNGELPSLNRLSLSGNQIDAIYFSPIGPPANLSYIDLSNNGIRLIPGGINGLNSLTYLDLSFNEISALLENYFTGLSSLSYLDVSHNEFQGPIPPQYGNLNNLGKLDLSHNALTGCIPSTYSSLCPIRDKITLDNNCNLGMPSFADWCEGDECFTTIQLDGPLANCQGRMITISAPEGYDLYQWSPPCGSTVSSNSNSISRNCPGTYSVTVTNDKGCTLTGSLTVNPFVEPDQSANVSFCEGGSVPVGGTTISTPGIHPIPSISPSGCPFTLYVSASVIPRPRRTVFLEICEGDSESLHGVTYNSAGTFTQEVNNPSGCDSILTVNVAILPVYETAIEIFACPDDEAEHDGMLYPIGSHTRNYQAANGCDSTLLIEVTELPTFDTNVSLEVCTGLEVEHDGVLYGVGNYERIYVAQNGCDSTVLISVSELQADYNIEEYEICNGQSINLYGSDYTGGTHFIDFVNAEGCASILEARISETAPYEVFESFLMCDGEPINYEGHTYWSGGQYTDELVDDEGCNYIAYIDIMEAQSTDTTVYLPRCDLQYPIYFMGEAFYNNSGSIRITNSQGCDSLIRVRIYHANSNEETIYPEPVCYPDQVEVNGISYGYTNVFEQHLTNAAGCDSTLYINVVVNHRESENITEYICPGGSVSVNNYTYDEVGNYTQYLTTTAGCDSILRISVRMTDLIVEENHIVLCGSETYTENGTTYSETGVDEKMFTTAEGCDSMYRLFINKFEHTSETIFDRLCTGDTLQFNDEKISSGGIYIQDLVNQNGCDSTLTIVVEEFSPSSSSVFRETCEGIPYSENGYTYTENGIYHQILINAVGCDSILTLNLTVHPHTEETLNIELCLGQSTEINGVVYDDNQSDVQHLTNAAGCDSTLYIEVEVIEAIYADHFIDLCEGQDITYNGEYFDQTTITQQFFTASSGCDSILTVYVTVHEDTFGELQAFVCMGDYVEINGVRYFDGGIKVQALTNTKGCDSTLTIYVEERFPSSSQNTYYFCEGDGIEINDVQYEYGGNFEQVYVNAAGCDSIFYIELIEFPDTESHEQYFICPGEKVNVNNQEYDAIGIFEQAFTNSYGCDSTLIIDIQYAPPKDTTLYAFICEEEVYQWKGSTYENAGEYRFDTLTVRGCDSIVHLSLGYLSGNDTTIYRTICKGDFYQFGSKQLTRSGSYFDHIIIGGCKSPTTLELEVLEPVIGYDNWHICEGDRIWIDGKYVTEEGLYEEHLSSKAGCDSTVIIDLVVKEHVETRIDTFICQGGQVKIGTIVYDSPGFFVSRRKTSYGCDSLVKINVELYDTVPDIFEFEVCSGDTIEFDGESYTQGQYAGSYFDGICQQGFVLNVNVVETVVRDHTLVKCDETLQYLGHEYQHSGQYLLQQDLDGCERIRYLNIIDASDPNSEVNVFACEGSEIHLNNALITDDGTYEMSSCSDQTSTAKVYFINGDTLYLDRRIFPGESINIEGKTYKDAGEYLIKVGESSECETIVLLNIRLEACGGERTITAHICEGETYNFNGQDIQNSGNYVYTKNLGHSNCDSIIHLDLAVNSIESFAIEGASVFCEGDTIELTGPDGFNYQWSTGEKSASILISREGEYSLTVIDENGCSRSSAIELQSISFPTSLDIRRTSPKSCEVDDGSLFIEMEDTDQYLYSINGGIDWSENPSFTNLGSGVYDIKITDRSRICMRPGEILVELRNSNIPVIENISTKPFNSCTLEKGSIEIITAKNGENYKYSIDNGASWSSDHTFSDLGTGEYLVLVSDESFSCVNDFSSPVLVEDVGLLFAKLGEERPLSCNEASDASLSLNIVDGTAPFEITWENLSTQELIESPNDLSFGTYQVTVRDSNGCIVALTHEIEEVVLEEIVANFTDTVICKNDTLFFALEADKPYEYFIFHNDIYLPDGISSGITKAGHYQVIAQYDEFCLIDKSFIVEFPDLEDAGMNFLLSSHAVLGEEVVLVETSEHQYIFEGWEYDTNNMVMERQDSLSYLLHFQDTGRYEIRLNAIIDGCLADLTKSIVVFQDTTEWIEEQEHLYQDRLELLSWSVTPNPNRGEFFVKVRLSDEGSFRLSVFDIFGNKVVSRNFDHDDGFEEQFVLPNLSSGLYSILLEVDGFRASKTLLVIR